MCAIAGIINHHATPDVERIVRKMCNQQAHRGPDGSGFFCNDEIAFGHRRLAIIDPAHGAQPITNEDGSVVVILNGEIYNYRKLRQELEKRGHEFKTDTDTEVIVHLYEELGSECVGMLDGMFAFAVYNSRTRRVLLARDRMGKKPLLYFMTGDTLIFASELNALRCHPQMPRELDETAISDFLSLHYIPCPNTVYRNVRKLPPAHQLELRFPEGTVSIRSYWHLDYSLKQNELSFDDAAHELRRLVERAVEKRLMTDVPLGTFLSGGLDSTIVAGLAARFRAPAETDAFTIGFEVAAYDERKWASAAARSINSRTGGKLRHFEQVVDPCDFALLEKLAAHYGEPYADASMLPTYLLSRFAREHITVALSGDGADEVFSGYERYLAMRYAARVDALPGPVRKLLFHVLVQTLPDRGERTLLGRTRRLLHMLASRPERRYFDMLDHCPNPMKQALFGERLRGVLQHDSAELFDSLQWELTSANRFERLAELDLHAYLANDILPKVDIASMAASLEVRSPFLDREVVEFAAKLPFDYKLHGRNRKRILKAAFADLVPPELAERPKKGFGVPVSLWLRGEWRDLAATELFEGTLVSDGFIQPKTLHTLWAAHQSGRRDHGYLLWGLLILSMFLNRNK
ncbi:asparagine synthase (glutamine-hydrolyzing) [Victivallis vadensis]|uniref:asparagine synthase (glutamine-hydrolyzing) n=1 Tax=Victivallis vadensis TaxID=172901 RepID=UPI0023F39D41|nr:asparagine synthase (glutamine-hydrolyzing) [Victivallis vadensis]